MKLLVETVYRERKNRIKVKTRLRRNHYLTTIQYVVNGKYDFKSKVSLTLRGALRTHSTFVRNNLEKLIG